MDKPLEIFPLLSKRGVIFDRLHMYIFLNEQKFITNMQHGTLLQSNREGGTKISGHFGPKALQFSIS